MTAKHPMIPFPVIVRATDLSLIHISNLGKYNEGELVGAWFTPPVDFEEVKERIGLNDEYEEYAIHDYELPFELSLIHIWWLPLSFWH